MEGRIGNRRGGEKRGEEGKREEGRKEDFRVFLQVQICHYSNSCLLGRGLVVMFSDVYRVAQKK